jgi:hypothetical protein
MVNIKMAGLSFDASDANRIRVTAISSTAPLGGRLLLLATLALASGCDRREALVEKCVQAYLDGKLVAEGPARVQCMRAAYGNTPQQ